MRLNGKAALVTGAGQGFGYGIAEAFVREGARVACLDVKGDVAEAAAKRLGPSAMALTADVSSRADVERAAKQAIDALGRIDIVVNNAGTTHRNKPLMEVQEAEFDRIFAVNVKSILLAAQAFVPHMRSHGGGVFINVGSTAALRPRPGLTVYNSSKGAVHVMTKSMAVELAPDKISRLRARARGRRDAVARHVHGRGHAREARSLQGHGSAWPVFDAPRHRPRGALPGERRGELPDRGGARGRWRAMHLICAETRAVRRADMARRRATGRGACTRKRQPSPACPSVELPGLSSGASRRVIVWRRSHLSICSQTMSSNLTPLREQMDAR